MKAKLKTNMIVGDPGNKVFLREGEMIDVDKIPPRFRKRRYILKEGERDISEEERKAQMAYAEGEVEDVEELLEEESPGNLVRRSRRGG